MSETAISRFPVPDLDAIPTDIRERMEAVQEKTGFIPNVFMAMAWRPDEFRAFMQHHDVLMEQPSGLSKAEREMIVVATSALNQCLYCVIAHGAILRIRAKAPELADQLATNWHKAPLSERLQAMLQFAVKVSGDGAAISEEDFAPLRAAGFSEDDIWDIGAIAAFFAQSNRLANMASIMPNREFYTMGR